jgi:hypothetical protein
MLLPDVVPEEIRVDYHSACVLWLFGNKFPRFYDWTVLHIGIALEVAFRSVFINRGTEIKKDTRFIDIIRTALNEEVITEGALRSAGWLGELLELHEFRQKFEYELAEIADEIGEEYELKTLPPFVAVLAGLLHRLRLVRNALAHGEYVLPDTDTTITREVARYYLELGRSFLLALFPSADGPPNTRLSGNALGRLGDSHSLPESAKGVNYDAN